jgi:hypothetical protein
VKIIPLRPYHADELGIDDPDNVIWGIYSGACVDERGAWGIWQDADAHAHSLSKNEWYGWICIHDPKKVLTRAGSASDLVLHEYAHLLVPDAGHTTRWKQEVTRIGGGREIQRCRFKPL